MIIKRQFSSSLPREATSPSKIKKREKGIWQRRFWGHCIRNEGDWRQHMDYIHFNPIKHGFTDKLGDWQYSSFQKAVDKGWYESIVSIIDDFDGIGHE